MSVLRLAIPSPLRRYFDYLPPPGLDEQKLEQLVPGTRLRVPFGRREVTGYLLEVRADSDAPEGSLKPAFELLDEKSLLPPELFKLCEWAAAYYHHPPGEVFLAAFPKRLREGKAPLPGGERAVRLTVRGRGLAPGALARSPRQAEAVALLRDADAATVTALKDAGINSSVLRSLREKDLVEQCHLDIGVTPAVAAAGLTPNAEQSAAIHAVQAAAGAFSCHLLEGVTGSGKTEVYLQLIADCLERNQAALVLIPEIGLTPQTVARFEARFDTTIAVLHSGLSDAQRYQAWEHARTGRAPIVIGTRSAVFTPLANLGLVIVDEEHDGSYKQQDGFRYSARDVAIKRAQLNDCPVLLGSATPSLESIHNVELGRYAHHPLTERAGGSELPAIRVLDVRKQSLQAGLSEPLIAQVETTLRAGRQALLFLNRRGYAPTLQCHDCGWVAQCNACDARLTVHRRRRALRCHHCGAGRALLQRCPDCHSDQLLAAGLGTEQSDDFLRQRFAEFTVHRVDSDSMSGRDAMQSLVDDINRGEPCILLGTQMLTKGHHFPGVSLVAVIDADAMLFSADFRGEERMAQLLTQVAGRAGREGAHGDVILQTHYPDHPAVVTLTDGDYASHARKMLRERHERGLPPVGQLLIVRTDCPDAAWGERFLQELRRAGESRLPQGVHLIGPLPSPMPRRAGRFRSQLLIGAPARPQAQAAASLLVELAQGLPVKHSLNWSIDIDPQDIF
ncbi:MAG: primosomal protein N' [Halioglobus sp.]|nr:primosomal protein N' [Halioglobus sp.]